MKKLFLSILLMAFTLLASAYDCQVDGIYYNLIDGKFAEVTSGGNNYLGEVVIPEKFTYKGVEYPVESIGEKAFYPSRLTSVTIPNSVKSIGNYAFYYCDGLTSVTIPNSVTSIGERAFSSCTALTSVTIGNSVTSIGYEVFRDCSSLTSITIPNSVTSIGQSAFSGCTSLSAVTVDAANNKYDSRDNCNAIIETSTNTLIAGCMTTTIPSSVTRIGNGAFNGYTSLTSITIPNSVTSIGDSAFGGCSALSSITIPNSVTSIGNGAFGRCSGLSSITIPNSVTVIGNSAFYGCTSLTSITIPNSVTVIRSFTFYGCSSLTSITIPNSLKGIDMQAFVDCGNLKEVYCYAETVPSANSDVFRGECNPQNAILYVPSSAINEYKAKYPWSEFGTILPLPDETGIENDAKQKAERTDRYIPDGRRVETPKKGLNIIRMSDGTTKKVVVM